MGMVDPLKSALSAALKGFTPNYRLTSSRQRHHLLLHQACYMVGYHGNMASSDLPQHSGKWRHLNYISIHLRRLGEK